MRSSVALACWMVALPSAAANVDAVLALQSDKVVRGASQSGGDAVLAADIGWRGEGLSLIGGLSTLGRDRSRGGAELTLGAGLNGNFDDELAWRAGLTGYATLGQGINRRPTYGEGSTSLAWQGREQSLQALLALAPAYPGFTGAPPAAAPARGRALFAEATWHRPLRAGWALDAGLGHASYRDLAFRDYRYGSLSLGWRRQGLQVVASRIFSTSPAPTVRGPRAVFSVLWSL